MGFTIGALVKAIGDHQLQTITSSEAKSILNIGEGDVVGLVGDLALKAPTTRLINTTAPLTGGGDLSTDRTLDISNFTGDSGSGGAKGAVPAPVAGDSAAGKFLSAGGGWAVPPGSSYTADESTLHLAGTVFSEKDNGTTNAKLAQMPAGTIKGNNLGVTGNALDLNAASVKGLLGITEADVSGLTTDLTNRPTYQQSLGLWAMGF